MNVLISIRPQFQFAITQERREEGGGEGGRIFQVYLEVVGRGGGEIVVL